MSAWRTPRIIKWLEERPIVRLAVWYTALIGGSWALLTFFPELATRIHPFPIANSKKELMGEAQGHDWLAMDLAIEATLATAWAFLLAIPAAWVYQLTRSKKGYQQSVVQSIVLLPVLVACVVVMVKGSLALAFGLAGIVAAVRFKNSLDDSKDAVYVFLAIALGLAAGVEGGVALAISLLFNAVTLLFWVTDFGRAPANLEGKRAEERLRRAKEIANRTSAFVAMVDEEILKEMSPDQLDVLADRAWRRKKKAATDEEVEDKRPEYDHLLRVHTADVGRARAAVEPLLVEARLKGWRFGHVVHAPEGDIIEYSVRLRQGDSPDDLASRIRALGPERVTTVEVK